MRLQFKFSQSVSQGARSDVIDAVREAAPAKVAPLFAGESDPELASLYSVEVAHDAGLRKVKALLDDSSAVEFAEEDTPRKLIRPVISD